MSPVPGFAFVDGALDRAEHLRDDPPALERLWAGARVLLLDGDDRAHVDDAGALATVDARAVAPRFAGLADAVFLGLGGGGQGWFAVRQANADDSQAPGLDLRAAAAQWPAFAATAFAQARAVLHWRRRHRFCAACGGMLAFERAGWLGRCAGCGSEHYPRTDPAVIVAVSDGARLLLGRSPGWPPRRWSVLAGFVEPGESLEQTVTREVFEESGVRVRDPRYLASQPWPFPSSLMLAFEADADGDAPVVGDELEAARWFDRAEIGAALEGRGGDDGILLSPRISVSRWLIDRWYHGSP